MDIEEVWKQFGERLSKFVYHHVADAHTADDLTQELLIKVYQNINSLQDHDRIEAWLYRIARNVINDYYRKNTRNKEKSSPDMDTLVDSIETSDNQIREELGRCIKPFINQLPAKYSDALTAVDLEGDSQKALADRLGVSHSTVKSQVQRGRAQLRKLFRQCCDFNIDIRGNVTDYKPKSGQCKCNTDC